MAKADFEIRADEINGNEKEFRRLMKKYPEFTKDFSLKRSVTALCRYLALRENGQDHKWAVMLATKQFPGIKTDTNYAAEIRRGGGSRIGDLYSDREIAHFQAVAKKKGVSINPNYHYVPSMARYPGDPRAFLDPQEARSAMKRHCEDQGIGCAELGTKHRQPEKDPLDLGDYLSPNVANEMAMNEFLSDERNRSLTGKARETKIAELNDKAKEKHAFNPRRRPVPVDQDSAPAQVKEYIANLSKEQK